MKRIGFCLLSLGLAIAGMSVARAEEGGKAAASETQMMQGEVLDMACYMGHGASGPKHAKCAKMCVDGGSPAGLLTSDGSVVLLLEDHGKNAKAFAAVKDLAGAQAKVTGTLSKKGGLTALIVSKAEAAK